MKITIFGKNKEKIKGVVSAAGFEIVREKPEFIISYGGDGTLMHAEAEYPGVPKILLKDSYICKKCSPLPNDEVLAKIANKKFRIEELMKLEVATGGKKLYGMNDIIVHNKDPRHAIRYSISVNNKLIDHHVIGDGIVAATPFGSTGYYRSITDSFFELGIGLAFNNSIEQSDHMVLKEDSTIKIKIIRGPALVYADNQENKIEINEGDEVEIKQSKQKAYIVIPL